MAKTSTSSLRIKKRTWTDPATGTTRDILLVRQGNFFIRIPLEQAYAFVNKVHDLTEAQEQEQQR